MLFSLLLCWAWIGFAEEISNPQPAAASAGLPQEAAGSPFDWAKLNTDEWIKGEVLSMYVHTIRFKSRKFKIREYKWKAIRRLVTAKPYRLGFKTGPPLTGRMDIDRDTVTVYPADDQPAQRFDRSELLSISPEGTTEVALWTADISFSLNLRGGNSDQQIYQGDVDLRRREPKSRIIVNYTGNYTKTGGDSSVNNHRFFTGYDRLITNRFFVRPIVYDYFRDPFKNLSQRHSLIPGVGYIVLDTPRAFWSTAGGLGYQYVKYGSVPKGESRHESTPVLVLATEYKLAVTEALDFQTRYFANIVNEDAGRYFHDWVGKLSVGITTLLDLSVTLGWERLQKPRRNSNGERPEKDDYYLLFGLRIQF